jgi:hypothetical protein
VLTSRGGGVEICLQIGFAQRALARSPLRLRQTSCMWTGVASALTHELQS